MERTNKKGLFIEGYAFNVKSVSVIIPQRRVIVPYSQEIRKYDVLWDVNNVMSGQHAYVTSVFMGSHAMHVMLGDKKQQSSIKMTEPILEPIGDALLNIYADIRTISPIVDYCYKMNTMDIETLQLSHYVAKLMTEEEFEPHFRRTVETDYNNDMCHLVWASKVWIEGGVFIVVSRAFLTTRDATNKLWQIMNA